MLGAEFAVIDLETTGFNARGSDRVIEIGIVVVGSDGAYLETYSTLINPNRDLGPTDIHGITGRDVAGAPSFSEVVGDICARLRGRVLAAHNARFDLDFLESEFARCGHTLPNVPRICTMALGSCTTGARRLDACCQSLGIEHENAHNALGDASATAALLLACAECECDWHEYVAQALDSSPYPDDAAWPSIPPSGRAVVRGQSGAQRDSYLATLIDRLPPDGDATDEAETAYLGLLDRVLEDRKVTADERDALADVALEWGIGRLSLAFLHDRYLRSLVSVARQDGVVTDAERRDLEDVRDLLVIDGGRLDELLSDPALAMPSTTSGIDHKGEDLTGLSVCFTGQLTCTRNGRLITREEAERLATEHGLVVKGNVSKKLDVLVVSDPDSLSGKARKAREYGTRIMVEAAFWLALGVDID